MKNNIFIKIIYISLGLSFLVTFLFYFYIFFERKVSNDPSDWGVFGDFIGGVLNPITAALNVLVFIYLSKIISESDEKARERDLEHQKKLTLAELKHSSYSELAQHLDSLTSMLMNDDRNLEYKTTILTAVIKGFFINFSYLFPLFNDEKNINPILTLLHKISDTILQMGNTTTENWEKRRELNQTFTELVKNYYAEKAILMKKLQVDILQ